jgi:DNA-binding transcriptional MerR regulator
MLRRMFTVGAFARLAGVSAKLLRAYDELGLFRPAWVDPQTGYRFYTPAQLPELRRILSLRDMGMPLVDIANVIKTGDLRESLEKRRSELERERAEVERRLASLEISVDMAEAGSNVPDVVVRHVKEQNVATLALDLVEGRSAEKGFYELETAVRDLKARAARPPGALIAPATDANGQPTLRVEVFVPISKPVAETDRIKTRVLPAARVATLLHRGSYGTLAGARKQLDEWARRSGLRTQRALRILYLQFGAEAELGIPKAFVVDRSADLVTEIQLPIETAG